MSVRQGDGGTLETPVGVDLEALHGGAGVVALARDGHGGRASVHVVCVADGVVGALRQIVPVEIHLHHRGEGAAGVLLRGDVGNHAAGHHDLPLGVERQVGSERHALEVGVVRTRAVGGGVPSRESVVLAGEAAGCKRRGGVLLDVLVVVVARAAVGLEGHRCCRADLIGIGGVAAAEHSVAAGGSDAIDFVLPGVARGEHAASDVDGTTICATIKIAVADGSSTVDSSRSINITAADSDITIAKITAADASAALTAASGNDSTAIDSDMTIASAPVMSAAADASAARTAASGNDSTAIDCDITRIISIISANTGIIPLPVDGVYLSRLSALSVNGERLAAVYGNTR